MNDLLNEIKRRVDLVSLIGKYTRLIRKNNRYWGCCPFHQEKTPSFTINTEEGFFKCFGCGVGGDVIKFIQLAENLDFNEALKFLAHELNIDLNQYRKHKTSLVTKSEREAILYAHNLANQFFINNLYNSRFGQQVQEYLIHRDISPQITRTFSLGVSLDSWFALTDYLLKNGITVDIIVKSGLASYSERESKLFDRFRARLMFPIKDRHGQVIAFGGRAIKKEDEPKYLNSVATVIYDKSSTLYGLDISASEIKQKKSVVLVEGYIDLISLWAAGIKNVVATCGTALTPTQAKLISRLTDTILICYDGDNAGFEATIKAAKIFIELGYLPKVIDLPENKDPDDIRIQNGNETLIRLVQSPVSCIEFIVRKLIRIYGLEPESKKKTLDYIKEIIKLSPEQIYIEEMAIEAASILNIDVNMLLKGLDRKKIHSLVQNKINNSNIAETAEQKLEIEVLSLMVKDKNIRDIYLNVIPHSLTDFEFNSKLLSLWQHSLEYEEFPDEKIKDYYNYLLSLELLRIKNKEDIYWAIVKLIQYKIDQIEGLASTHFKKYSNDKEKEKREILRGIFQELLNCKKALNSLREPNNCIVLFEIISRLDELSDKTKKLGDSVIAQ